MLFVETAFQNWVPDADPMQLILQGAAGSLQSAPGKCPRCQTTYAIQGMQADAQGHLGFAIAIVSAPSQA